VFDPLPRRTRRREFAAGPTGAGQPIPPPIPS